MTDASGMKHEDTIITPSRKRARERSDDRSPSNSGDDDSSATGDTDYIDSLMPDVAAPAYDERFLKVHTDLAALADEVSGIIEASGCDVADGNAIHGTSRRARGLRDRPTVAKTRALLVGDSGVGKSSLINALLEIPLLAKVVTSGRSVTTVALSYERPLEGQTSRYDIQVDYLPEGEVTSLMGEFLKDFTLPASSLDGFAPDEVNHIVKAGESAFEALSHLFHGKPEFKSPAALTRFLEAHESSVETLPTKLASMAEGMLKSRLKPGSRSTACIQQDDLADFHLKLESLTSSAPGRLEPSAHPLIKQVRVGVHDNVLLEHFTIVDCPGRSDINIINAKALYNQLDDCDELWIVTWAGRIETQDLVADFTLQFGKSKKHTVVISTRSEDDIGNGDALLEHLQQQGVDVSHIQELRQRRAQLDRARNQAKDEFEKLKREKKHSERAAKKAKAQRTSSGDTENNALASNAIRYFKAKADVEEADSACLTALVEARSTDNTIRLRERFEKNLARGKKLEVFFVSKNTHYESNVNGDDSGVLLSLEATQIPALRRYVEARVASKILAATKTYITSQFAPLMHDIRFYVDPIKLRVNGSQKANGTVDPHVQRLTEILDAYLAEATSSTQSLLIEPLLADRAAQIEHAVRVVGEKRQWAQSTIKIWIQGNGKAHTRLRREESWNEQFAAASIATIGQNWDKWVDEGDRLVDVLFEGLSDAIRAVVRDIEQDVLGQNDHFDKFVDSHIESLGTARERFAAQRETAMNIVYSRVDTDGPESSSRIGMTGIYNKCKGMYGTGSRYDIMTTLEGFLKRQDETSPFSIMAVDMCENIRHRAEEQVATLRTVVQGIFGDLKSGLEDLLKGQREAEQQVALRERLREWLGRVEKEFESIKARLEEIKRSYICEHNEAEAGEEHIRSTDEDQGLFVT